MVVDNESPEVDALQRAIVAIGSQAKMARLLELSQTAVWKWVSKRQPLPPKHVLAVEAATGVSRHDLRPDIYPRDPAPAAPGADPAQFEHAR